MKLNKYFSLIFIALFLAINISAQSTSFRFSDQIESSGLSPKVDSISGHGAAWGDIDGDGWADLFVGVFAYGERTNMLFRNKNGKFEFDDQGVFRFPTRPTGMVFADLDNDGDLDLYFASMPLEVGKNKTLPDGTIGNSLFRNDGKGNFTNISKSSGACPSDLGGRGVAIFDYDGDGLLDILAGSDPMPGYSGSETKSSRLFKNMGNLQFIDVTKEAGIPDNVPGYGVAACDINNDGWPDFFIACNDGGNRLFINGGKGRFHENEKLNELFKWQWSGGSNMVCGVAFGDVNRDGLMDIVLGSHFQLPWFYPQPIRLFLNRGDINNELSFEEVTLQAALPPIHIKTPHVEIQDFDNDGWPDIYTSAVKYSGNSVHPIISKNSGVSGKGIPKFVTDANDVNDFPTIEELNYMRTHGTDDIFLKIQYDKRITYMAPGPVCDYNNDGLMDIFLASWWKEFPSMLLRNETVNSNNWIKIRIQDVKGINTMGLGSKIKVYKAGRLGQAEDLIGSNEICISNGYASGQTAIAHFGLGETSNVDIEVILPHNKGKITRKGVKANQLITIN
ncbi:MAG TPA: hypothetical protein DIW17_11105 [Clostridiales bacterium]|nr:hypothetical protein [Clostridiales bacterium]